MISGAEGNTRPAAIRVGVGRRNSTEGRACEYLEYAARLIKSVGWKSGMGEDTFCVRVYFFSRGMYNVADFGVVKMSVAFNDAEQMGLGGSEGGEKRRGSVAVGVTGKNSVGVGEIDSEGISGGCCDGVAEILGRKWGRCLPFHGWLLLHWNQSNC